jgi:hypothetical protein
MKTWGATDVDGTGARRAELLAELLRLERALGRPPTPADADRHGKFAAETYRERFPDWATALREAGLPAPRRSSESLG